MRFRKLIPSKFRPKDPATRKEGKACAFSPPALKAAEQHIDAERLPDSTGSIVAPTQASWGSFNDMAHLGAPAPPSQVDNKNPVSFFPYRVHVRKLRKCHDPIGERAEGD
jgi:hypothetical protein